ncbi:hypothetical protein VDIAB_30133 [Vibrio diabolicus]|nr:hypothetical protein VDIAB_30133 [Vibrio diabolicus]
MERVNPKVDFLFISDESFHLLEKNDALSETAWCDRKVLEEACSHQVCDVSLPKQALGLRLVTQRPELFGKSFE